MIEKIIKKFERIRDLPYKVGPLHEGDDLIRYGWGGCGPKNRYLAKYFYGLGYEVKVCWAPYRWKELDVLPSEIKKNPSVNRIGNHVYLKVKINNKWALIDATWDKGLYPLFSANINWDGKSNQIPATKIQKENCLDYPEPYLSWRKENIKNIQPTKQEKKFAIEMNNFFENIRKLNSKK